jgi:hypothetical protein
MLVAIFSRISARIFSTWASILAVVVSVVAVRVTNQPAVRVVMSAWQYRQRPVSSGWAGAPHTGHTATAPDAWVRDDDGRWNNHRSDHVRWLASRPHEAYTAGSVDTSKPMRAL